MDTSATHVLLGSEAIVGILFSSSNKPAISVSWWFHKPAPLPKNQFKLGRMVEVHLT